MNVRINESGNNGEIADVDSFGAFRNTNILTKPDSFEPVISDHNASGREPIGGTQNDASIDNESPVTHDRRPDAPKPSADCRRLR